MRITSGWWDSKHKLTVDLGEEDLARILTTHGIEPDKALPLREVYKILYCEAEILSRAAMVRHLLADEAGEEAIGVVQAEIEALKRERNAVLEPHKPKPRAARARDKEPAGT